jgi:hypothetical protein
VSGTVCGNGAAVLGTGSTAECSAGSQSSSSGGTGTSNPSLQVDLCGNGVAVVGSTATCAVISAIGDPTVGSGATGPIQVAGVQAASARGLAGPGGDASSSPDGSSGGQLPVTGSTLMLAIVGLALVVTGAVGMSLPRRSAQSR